MEVCSVHTEDKNKQSTDNNKGGEWRRIIAGQAEAILLGGRISQRSRDSVQYARRGMRYIAFSVDACSDSVKTFVFA